MRTLISKKLSEFYFNVCSWQGANFNVQKAENAMNTYPDSKNIVRFGISTEFYPRMQVSRQIDDKTYFVPIFVGILFMIFGK